MHIDVTCERVLRTSIELFVLVSKESNVWTWEACTAIEENRQEVPAFPESLENVLPIRHNPRIVAYLKEIVYSVMLQLKLFQVDAHLSLRISEASVIAISKAW